MGVATATATATATAAAAATATAMSNPEDAMRVLPKAVPRFVIVC